MSKILRAKRERVYTQYQVKLRNYKRGGAGEEVKGGTEAISQ